MCPSIIAMLVGSVYNITDQIFIGQVVGMLGNAATNVVFPLVGLSIAVAQLVGVGLAANFNTKTLKKGKAACKAALQQAVGLNVDPNGRRTPRPSWAPASPC